MSTDPAGPVDGLNLYEYVRGNPVKLVDPEGKSGWDTILSKAQGFKAEVSRRINTLENDIISYAQESATRQHELGLITAEQKEAGVKSAAYFSAVVGTAAQFTAEMTINLPASAVQAMDHAATSLGEGAAKVATGDTIDGLKQMADVTGLMSSAENMGEGAAQMLYGDFSEGSEKFFGGMAGVAGNAAGMVKVGNAVRPHVKPMAQHAKAMLSNERGSVNLSKSIDVNAGASGTAQRPIVIGENMARVQKYADGIGGQAYKPWKNDPFDYNLGMQRNTRWINDMKRQGREIIDIGPDFQRRKLGRDPSDFYKMERMQTKDYSNYSSVFQRTGKYSGGVPGLDF